MRRLTTLALTAAACLAAVVLAAASARSDANVEYRIEFHNAFGLVEGADFRVGGVNAGQLTGFVAKRRKGRSPTAVVTAQISEPGLADFREDASCEIRPQSLIGEYFVTCQPGSSSKRLPKDGTGTVPVRQTASTIPLDLVNNVMRRPVRERLRLIITELGTGLAGRPDDLQEVLRRAHPGLRETTRVLRILGDQSKVIEDFISDSDRVVEELERNKRDVARFVVEAGETAEISATRRVELRQTFRRLPGFLSELRPTMSRLSELSREQVPLLSDLQRGAPHLNTFLARVGPFAEASRPAVRSLGRAARVGTRAVREGRQELRQLRALARYLPATGRTPDRQGVARSLRQFLHTMDERGRAIEPDERARTGAPPPPDPTHIPAGRQGGFTGLEAIWNYFFWQALTTNSADEYGHILKVIGIVNGCRPYRVRRDPEDRSFDECRQWLGPHQPGVNAPDPTTQRASGAARRDRRPARRRGESRGRGQPAAGPVPGQRDASRPQLTPPPALRRLLAPLTGAPPGRSSPPPTQPPPSTRPREHQLLDFLLGP